MPTAAYRKWQLPRNGLKKSSTVVDSRVSLTQVVSSTGRDGAPASNGGISSFIHRKVLMAMLAVRRLLFILLLIASAASCAAPDLPSRQECIVRVESLAPDSTAFQTKGLH